MAERAASAPSCHVVTNQPIHAYTGCVSARKPDEELMQAYRMGDEGAFRALYDRHGSRLYGYLRLKLRVPQELDEVYQAVWAKLHRTRGEYDPRYKFEQWLYVIARTAVLDRLRAGARSRKLEEAMAEETRFDELVRRRLDTSEAHASLESEEVALTVLEDLAPEQRRAVEMRVLEEMEYDEIAERLGKSEAGVRQIVSRALRRLRLNFARAGGA